MARRPGKWGWWLGGGLVAAAGAGLLILRRPATGSVAAAQPVLVGVSSLIGPPGSPLQAPLSFDAPAGAATAATTIPVAFGLSDGSATATLAANAAVPAIPVGGGPVLVHATTGGDVRASFAPGTVGVAATTLGKTVSGSYSVAAPAASFRFAASTLGTLTASATGAVPVQVEVENTGGTAAIPSFSGGVTYGGQQVAAWAPTGTLPLVQAGENATVGLSLTVPDTVPAGSDPATLTVAP